MIIVADCMIEVTSRDFVVLAENILSNLVLVPSCTRHSSLVSLLHVLSIQIHEPLGEVHISPLLAVILSHAAFVYEVVLNHFFLLFAFVFLQDQTDLLNVLLLHAFVAELVFYFALELGFDSH